MSYTDLNPPPDTFDDPDFLEFVEEVESDALLEFPDPDENDEYLDQDDL